jgi:hypothetical protein
VGLALDPQIKGGICQIHPSGECTLVEAVDLIASAIAHCRKHRINRLLVNATGLLGVPVPTLVDRFLMAEQWAREANAVVVVALVIRAEYIHPKKFGVRVAADFGLVSDVYTSEDDALKWLSRGRIP